MVVWARWSFSYTGSVAVKLADDARQRSERSLPGPLLSIEGGGSSVSRDPLFSCSQLEPLSWVSIKREKRVQMVHAHVDILRVPDIPTTT